MSSEGGVKMGLKGRRSGDSCLGKEWRWVSREKWRGGKMGV